MASTTAAAALLTMLTGAPAGADAGQWQKVGGDARSGVSGLAYEGRTADGEGVYALAVHDNKQSGQQRLSLITHREGSDSVSPITWDGPEPVDLEAIEAVPGMPGEYLALASRGIVYRLKVSGSTAEVVDYTPLPGSPRATISRALHSSPGTGSSPHCGPIGEPARTVPPR
ncbi:hypothetical protein ABZ622_35595 [Streptomyces sp. NPDC007164]|uniref:hypothetical protein n=1 Tax=Streptomyces sp. NPDC007164 TaxID=3156918 RepID=UPI0033D87135